VRDVFGRGGLGGGVEHGVGDVGAVDEVIGETGYLIEDAEEVLGLSSPDEIARQCGLGVVIGDDVPVTGALLKILIMSCARDPVHRVGHCSQQQIGRHMNDTKRTTKHSGQDPDLMLQS
jgi:hypothetical protein